MRIAVVSDTHLPRFGRELPRLLREGLAATRPDLIVHAGDLTSPDVPTLFERFGPFEAVAGNNDPPPIVERFGRRRLLEVGGLRIGLVHGDLGAGRTTAERASRSFGPAEVDLVVFGHSHVPLVERLTDGRWLVNPGSPTDRRREPLFTWALVEVRDGAVSEVALRTYDDRAV